MFVHKAVSLRWCRLHFQVCEAKSSPLHTVEVFSIDCVVLAASHIHCQILHLPLSICIFLLLFLLKDDPQNSHETRLFEPCSRRCLLKFSGDENARPLQPWSKQRHGSVVAVVATEQEGLAVAMPQGGTLVYQGRSAWVAP